MYESHTPVLVVIIGSNRFNLLNHRIDHRIANTGRDCWSGHHLIKAPSAQVEPPGFCLSPRKEMPERDRKSVV